MQITWQVVTFDAADLDAESAFWAGVLDGNVDRDGDWHMVTVGGEPRIGVQLAPDHVAPDWPDGTPPQQIHLDLPTSRSWRWVPESRAVTSRSMPTQPAIPSASVGWSGDEPSTKAIPTP